MLTKIVQKSCLEDRGIYANCQRLLLFDEERPTHEFYQTLKNFCCFLNLERQHGANLSKLSVILKTKIHIAIFCTGCKILITLLTSTVVEYYYFGRHKMCKIKMKPFLKQ